MAVDTRNKRSSCVNFTQPWRCQYPAPDGTININDRIAIAYLYSGITSSVSYSATCGLTMGSETLAATDTFSPGTHSATAALTMGSETLAATSTFAAGTHTAASVPLSLGSETLAATSTFAPGTHSATVALTTGSETLAATSTFRPGTHTASSVALAMLSETLNSTGHNPTINFGTGVLTISTMTAAGTATFTPKGTDTHYAGDGGDLVMRRRWLGVIKPYTSDIIVMPPPP